jgi:chromosome segregation ATPase
MGENIQLKRDVTTLRADCEKLKKVINDSNLEIEKQNSVNKKLNAQINQRQEELNKAMQNMKVMTEEIKDQTVYIGTIQDNYNRLCIENSQVKKMQNDYVRENAEVLEQNRQIKSQLNETRGVIEGLNEELQLTKEHLNTILSENENLHHTLNELKPKLDQSIDDNKRLVEDNEMAVAQNSIKLQTFLSTMKRLQDEVGKLKVENEKLKVISK